MAKKAPTMRKAVSFAPQYQKEHAAAIRAAGRDPFERTVGEHTPPPAKRPTSSQCLAASAKALAKALKAGTVRYIPLDAPPSPIVVDYAAASQLYLSGWKVPSGAIGPHWAANQGMSA